MRSLRKRGHHNDEIRMIIDEEIMKGSVTHYIVTSLHWIDPFTIQRFYGSTRRSR